MEEVDSLIEKLKGTGGWGNGRRTREAAARQLAVIGVEEAVFPLMDAYANTHHAPLWQSFEGGPQSIYERALFTVVIRNIHHRLVELGYGEFITIQIDAERLVGIGDAADGELEFYRDFFVDMPLTSMHKLVSQLMNDNDPMCRIGGAILAGEYDYYKQVRKFEALKDEKSKEKTRDILRGLRPEIELAAIFNAIYDSDPRVRWAATYALKEVELRAPSISRTGPADSPVMEGISTLVRALGDSVPLVRWGAEIAIGVIAKVNDLYTFTNDEGAFIDDLGPSDFYIGIMDSLVGPLLSNLSNPDYRVRLAAIFALGECRDDRSVEELIGILEDEDSPTNLRVESAAALGKIRSERAVGPLIGALGLTPDGWFADSVGWKGDDELVQLSFFAAEALAFGDERVMEPLVGLDQLRPNLFYDHVPKAMNEILTRSIHSILAPGDQEEVRWTRYSRWDRASFYLEPDMELILNNDQYQWYEQVWPLTSSFSKYMHWNRIIMYLDSESPLERFSAAWLMGHSVDFGGMIEKIPLTDPHPAVRWCALHAIRLLSNNLVFDLFIDGSIMAMSADDGDIHSMRRYGVERINDQAIYSTDGIISKYVNFRHWKLIHAASCSRRGELWDSLESVIGPLVGMMADESPVVKTELISLLYGIQTLFNIRGNTEDDRILSAMLAGLGDSKTIVRRTAARALRCFGDRCIEELERALGDDGFQVAEEALYSLEKIGRRSGEGGNQRGN